MFNHGKAARIELFIILALLVLAAATRIYGLSEWALMADEYYTYFKAYDRINTIINPAYYFLTVVCFEAFGVSEWAARLPAFLFGTLSVPVFYVTWSRVIGRNAAIISAILIILSSWHLWYSQQARFYPGVFIFGSLAFYFFLLHRFALHPTSPIT